jgi:mono/diheme cytochrome c family protein
MRFGSGFLVLASLALLAPPGPAGAQTDSAAARSSADAPFTALQAERGAAVYRRACAACHVATYFATPAFRRAWTGRTAWELFELIRTTMPNDNPGRLPRRDYADLVAYLLRLNGMPTGPVELATDPDSLRRVPLEFERDPR